jgi:hypothetical protein
MHFILLVACLTLVADSKLILSKNEKSLAGYLPQALKNHLPKQLLADLQKLTMKDIEVSQFLPFSIFKIILTYTR